MACFAIVGGLFWSELVASPPFVPHVSGGRRIALAVPAMWTVWLLAYLVAFTRNAWYPAYGHTRGTISLIADQQLAAGVLWGCATAAFLPVIFLNLMRFLSDEQDLDHELDEVVRAERRSPVPLLEPWRSSRRRRGGALPWSGGSKAQAVGGSPGQLSSSG